MSTGMVSSRLSHEAVAEHRHGVTLVAADGRLSARLDDRSARSWGCALAGVRMPRRVGVHGDRPCSDTPTSMDEASTEDTQ